MNDNVTRISGQPCWPVIGMFKVKATSSVSLATIKRLEAQPGLMAAHISTAAALKNALEQAGIEFIDENGTGEGVRFQKPRRSREK